MCLISHIWRVRYRGKMQKSLLDYDITVSNRVNPGGSVSDVCLLLKGGSRLGLCTSPEPLDRTMLSRARALAHKYRAQQLNDSALYWADKALSLSNCALEDLVVYIQCLFTCKQYRRAIHCLESSTTRTLLQRSSTLRYLTAR